MKTGTMQIFLILSKIIFFGLLIANAILPVVSTKQTGIGFWQIVISFIWTYGFLSSLGLIKKIVSQDEDGKIEYATTIPFLPVGVVRVLQFGWIIWRARSVFLPKNFIVLIALDVVYTVILLLDKSSYCYESVTGVGDDEDGEFGSFD